MKEDLHVTYYAHRDIGELDRAGGYYCRHVRAMSEEGLSSKADIAAELAFRDHKIAQLEAMLDTRAASVPGCATPGIAPATTSGAL